MSTTLALKVFIGRARPEPGVLMSGARREDRGADAAGSTRSRRWWRCCPEIGLIDSTILCEQERQVVHRRVDYLLMQRDGPVRW